MCAVPQSRPDRRRPIAIERYRAASAPERPSQPAVSPSFRSKSSHWVNIDRLLACSRPHDLSGPWAVGALVRVLTDWRLAHRCVGVAVGSRSARGGVAWHLPGPDRGREERQLNSEVLPGCRQLEVEASVPYSCRVVLTRLTISTTHTHTHTHSSLKLKYCIKYYGVCVVSGITLVVMVQFGSVTLGVGVVCRVVSLSKG